jgi:signal transduction histidine kinase
VVLKKTPDKDSLISVGIIMLATAVVTYFHYSVPNHFSAVHLAHYYIFYIIVIYAAFKFGFKGGVIVAAAMTVIYSPNAYLGVFTGHLGHHHVPSLVEISMIYAVGIVSGYFSGKLKDEKKKVEKMSAEKLLLEKKMAHDDRLRSLGQLSAGIAHEIRNPLAAIKSGIAMIKSGKTDPQITDILESEIERLNSFVNRFLQYARFGNNDAGDILLSSFLAELTELSKLTAARRDVSINVENNLPEDFTIFGDKNSLKQALLNLILNGVDALEGVDNGEVTLSAGFADGRVFFSVADNGCGMDNTDRIFEPFFTTKDDGTGLGLPIAGKIALAHGGEITVKSGNEGTVFTMYIQDRQK